MNKEPLNKTLHTWLSNRKISDIVIQQYELSCVGNKLVIPVHDIDGKIIFNKYRRDPKSEEGPKYTYDKGATASLFGLKTFGNEKIDTIIVEGELDALCLISHGLRAVSTTGGAGTFKKEWADFIAANSSNVYICYDHDDAGVNGAFNVHAMIPGSKIIWLPEEVGGGGDVTDYVKIFGNFNRLIPDAEQYQTPKPFDGIEKKAELEALEKEYIRFTEFYMMEARKLRSRYESDRHIQMLIQMYNNKRSDIRQEINNFTKTKKKFDDSPLKAAKQVPISKFVKFNGQRFANCLWHHEKTPSMFYYEKDNHVHCFACDKGGDVIDVVMQLHQMSLQEAIKFINSNG